MITRAMAMTSVRSVSCSEARMVVERSMAMVTFDVGRHRRLQTRQFGLDADRPCR